MLDLLVDTTKNMGVDGRVGLEICTVLDLQFQAVFSVVVIFNKDIEGFMVSYSVDVVEEVA